MYAKLFASLYQGTLRGQPNEILVFTNLLAHTGKDGTVDKHFRAIAEETGLSIDQVRAAIEVLESPDPESRSPEEHGARIVKLDEHRAWGWRVVNHGKYRAIRSEEDRAEQNRLAQARWRERRKQSKPGVSGDNADKPIQRQIQGTEAVQPKADASLPSLAEFCDFYCEKLPDLGEPVPRDNWLMEKHGYLASEVWPSRPPKNWKAMEGKLLADYRSRHAEKSAKTVNGSGRYAI